MAVLRILTWNIWMMPRWVHQSPRNAERAAAIVRLLRDLDVDIVCLQKVFDESTWATMDAALAGAFPHRYGPANPATGLKISSGLWVLSRIPLLGQREIQFEASAGIESLSRKGAMMLSGDLGKQTFDLVVTHLQGEEGPVYTEDHQRVRDQQIAQIRDQLLVPNEVDGSPIFLCGDFCTPRWFEESPDEDSPPYQQMLATLGATNGPGYRVTLDDTLRDNDLAESDTGRKAELDYILVRSSGCNVRGAWERLVLRDTAAPTGEQDLSYRYAVHARFEWE